MGKRIELDGSLEYMPSLLAQLVGLEVGDCVSRAKHLDGDEATKEVLGSAIADLRNSVAAAVNRASKKTGNSYTVETGEFRGRSLDVNAVVVVTRTE